MTARDACPNTLLSKCLTVSAQQASSATSVVALFKSSIVQLVTRLVTRNKASL